MDCSLPGFSVHGIFQARVLEWVAIVFSISHSPQPHTLLVLIQYFILQPEPVWLIKVLQEILTESLEKWPLSTESIGTSGLSSLALGSWLNRMHFFRKSLLRFETRNHSQREILMLLTMFFLWLPLKLFPPFNRSLISNYLPTQKEEMHLPSPLNQYCKPWTIRLPLRKKAFSSLLPFQIIPQFHKDNVSHGRQTESGLAVHSQSREPEVGFAA